MSTNATTESTAGATSSADQTSSDNLTYIYVAAGGGGALLIVGIICVIVFLKLRFKRDDKEAEDDDKNSRYSDDDSNYPGHGRRTSYAGGPYSNHGNRNSGYPNRGFTGDYFGDDDEDNFSDFRPPPMRPQQRSGLPRVGETLQPTTIRPPTSRQGNRRNSLNSLDFSDADSQYESRARGARGSPPYRGHGYQDDRRWSRDEMDYPEPPYRRDESPQRARSSSRDDFDSHQKYRDGDRDGRKFSDPRDRGRPGVHGANRHMGPPPMAPSTDRRNDADEPPFRGSSYFDEIQGQPTQRNDKPFGGPPGGPAKPRDDRDRYGNQPPDRQRHDKPKERRKVKRSLEDPVNVSFGQRDADLAFMRDTHGGPRYGYDPRGYDDRPYDQEPMDRSRGDSGMRGSRQYDRDYDRGPRNAGGRQPYDPRGDPNTPWNRLRERDSNLY